jgi:hypothetical protein
MREWRSSTPRLIKPYGGKMLVGDPIPGRQQALLAERCVSLATILSAGRDLPYYNEKDKAGNLYNEGWALTHMLCLRDELPAQVRPTDTRPFRRQGLGGGSCGDMRENRAAD